jgi:hypothetical protein
LLARYASIPDSRDFEELPETVFTDRVLWDFESVGAGPPIEIERDVFMQQLRTFFVDWQAAHHAITNHRVRVDGDVASIRAHIHAQHWLPPDVALQHRNRWLVVGFYDDEAVRTPDGRRLRKVRFSCNGPVCRCASEVVRELDRSTGVGDRFDQPQRGGHGPVGEHLLTGAEQHRVYPQVEPIDEAEAQQ